MQPKNELKHAWSPEHLLEKKPPTVHKVQRLLYITIKNCCKYLNKLKYYVTTQETGRDRSDISFCNIPVSTKTICRIQGWKFISSTNFSSNNKSLLPCHRKNFLLLGYSELLHILGWSIHWTFPFFPLHFCWKLGRDGKDSVPQMCNRQRAAPHILFFYFISAKAAVEIVERWK